MQRHNRSGTGQKELAIAYTDKPVSGWGGLISVFRFFDGLGLRTVLAHALPDGRTSPNKIPVVDMVLALFASVLSGGRRFAHVERLRSDAVVQAILDAPRLPSAMTLTRYFGGFVRAQVEQLVELLWRWMLQRLPAAPLGAVLDLDSTVFERYGEQEGSRKGHNPRKHGRPSHHPLLAVLAEAKIVLHAWLRSGNTGSARGVRAFLDEALARLPKSYQLYAVRADSGFFEAAVLGDLEQRQLPYAIAVRLTLPLKRRLAGLQNWQEFGPGLEVGEFQYETYGWSQPRRVVVVRERLRERPDARGRKLLEVPGYTFHAIVTTLALPAPEVWRFYNHRAESENRIKELKEDFGADGFCLQSFHGTEAVFRLICCLYNLFAEFKRDIVRESTTRLLTLRHQVLVVGAILGAEGRRRVLRLGLRGPWRARFATLLARIAITVRSTVTQLDFSTLRQQLGPPRRWKPRGGYTPLRLTPPLQLSGG
jgi:Transposase DDE domain group 1